MLQPLFDKFGNDVATEVLDDTRFLATVSVSVSPTFYSWIFTYVALPDALFGPGEHFILRAKGESMIEAEIAPGDLVVVRKQNTWAANGKKKVVWRCINRLDYGKKYCHNSPSIEESVLQEAIMKAVMQTAKQNAEVLKTLKLHIGMGLSAETTEDNSLDLQIRIAEIEAEFQKMLKAIAADNVEAFDEEKAKALMDEKVKLQIQLDRIADTKQKRENAKSRLDEIFMIIEALANYPISYDDQIVRQILESVIVESKEKIKVVFVGGLEVTQNM